MTVNELTAYELIEERKLEDLNSLGMILRHRKSGARVMVISNDDENKVFSIGFRTPPSDSTGVAHILEHSVLCGSKNFPVKDPFVELAKGSLNTFLNAMTYPDKTVYPVASCNDKDFQNLMHVYLDAVFFTNIYDREEIFRQEGWHYELESEDAKLSYNGVVYNEMKGVFSSPEDVLDREILNSLFPDTPYSVESGGDPKQIPNLKYSEFLNFHSKYYHPSNSYIYLYGDMDVAEKLDWMDREYLSLYDNMEIDSEIKQQEPFEQPVEIVKKYSITENESEEDNTYLSFNKVIGTSLDKELYLAFEILDYALISAPGAVLRQKLLDEKIGKDIMSSYDNGIRQPYFSIIAKNANPSDKERFINIIKETLEKTVAEGIDRKALLAGINYYEFKYREADFGSYPKGLMYGLQAYDSWLYDENSPFLHLEANATFAFLKNQVETGYFEKLIEKYLLRNPHASVVMIEPEKGMTTKMERELEEHLQSYKASLSGDEIRELIQKTKQLKQYQEEPSKIEDLEKIPMLKIEDIKKDAALLQNTEKNFEGITVLHHNMFTNGIGYLNLFFDLKYVPEELLPYVGILKSVLGYVDTKNYSYKDLFNEINIQTGGITGEISIYDNMEKPEDFTAGFELRTKVLYENLGFAFGMLEEIILYSKLEDERRLYEIIAQQKSRLQMTVTGAGHSMAALRALSYFSRTNYLMDLTSGIGFYKFIEKIENQYETEKSDLIQKLKQLMGYIFRSDTLIVSYTANEAGFSSLKQEVLKLKQKLHTGTGTLQSFHFPLELKNEGFKTSSQVQYVCRAGNFKNAGRDYTGALRVLKVILGYDYLWNEVRVKGGAYGCMSGFGRLGDCYMTSYRDPNLEKTIEVYEKAADYIRNFEVSGRDMTKYIIGTVSEMDVPMNPRARGMRSFRAYMNHLRYEDLQREREEVLSADQEKIRQLSEILEAVIEQKSLCVIGSEEKVEEQKALFNEIKNLICS